MDSGDDTTTRMRRPTGATTWGPATTDEIAFAPSLQCLAGRYRVLEPVGRGGTAWVYKVRDEHTGDLLAAKVLRTDIAAIGKLRERFAAEACAMTILDHPHIARVHDMGQDELTGADFVVLEWLSGGSLQEHLVEHGRFDAAQAVSIALDVLSALELAHARGIVHRDVKPGNVLLDPAGVVKVVDFGIARIPDAGGETDMGVVMGSLATMAPEQRLSAAAVTPATDVYSTGATLFQLVTAETPVDLFAVPPDDARWVGVPPELVPVIRKSTTYSQSRRYGSAGEMAEALAGLDLRS